MSYLTPHDTFPTGFNPFSGETRDKLNEVCDVVLDYEGLREAIIKKIAEPASQDEPGGAGLRPCKLTMTGGTPGSPTVPCSYVYTVKSLTGTTLKLNASPVWARPPKRKLLPATNGMYYFDVDGLQLATCDEVIDTVIC